MPNIPEIKIGNTTYKLKDTELGDTVGNLSIAVDGLNDDTSALGKAFLSENTGANIFNLLSFGIKNTVTKTGGLVIEFEKGVYHIHGTMSSSESYKFYNLTHEDTNNIMNYVVPGSKYWFGVQTIKANTDAKVTIHAFTKDSPDAASWTDNWSTSIGMEWKIPETVTNLLIRFDLTADVEYDHYVIPLLSMTNMGKLTKLVTNDYETLVANNKLLNTTNDLLAPYRDDYIFKVLNGVQYSPVNGRFTVRGTATSDAFYNLVSTNGSFPEGMEAGKQYLCVFDKSNPDDTSVMFEAWIRDANGTLQRYKYATAISNFVLYIPEDSTGVLFRLVVYRGGVANNVTCSFGVYPVELPSYESISIYGGDIHSIRKSGCYLANTDSSALTPQYSNNPVAPPFLILNYGIGKSVQYQIVSDWNGENLYISRRQGNNWTEWHHIGSGSGGDVINNYNTEYYNNTYDITCTPTITTDTNNYLASTGDTTDRTGDIQTMLNTTGICQLGPGDFYVTGIEIPTNSMLRGSGNKTRLVLSASVGTGYAVKLKTGGRVKDLKIDGNPAGTQITTPTSVGTRHGVLFEGTADAQSSPTTYYCSAVNDCSIQNFTGGGITMRNTGYSYQSDLLISDCFIRWCGAGINIAYFSEFHRITNVTCQACLYGCVDNGGNDNFANCDFSGNKVGLLIDNSQSQSPNNSHGSFVGCTFNHSDSNNGTAIRIMKATSGEIFTAPQIFYGAIEISESVGVRIIGGNFGNQTPISVTDSALVVFSDCTFKDSTNTPVTSFGNTRLAFKDCYLRDGSAYNPV